MRRAADEFDQVLVAFTENGRAPPAELLDVFCRSGAGASAGVHDLP